MTALFDVAARLAEGRVALEDAHTYVSAARQRGHSNSELTDLASWYGTEHGLDLQRLDADRAAVETAARAATEAVDLARGQLASLVRAWTGPGAAASVEFIRRHCDSAAAVADALTVAAQTCAALREELWRAVDTKVAATTAIVERVGTRRQSWLAAAQAVLTGAPDEAAVDIVDAQVAPFVATAIGNDWLRDMRTTAEAARDAYRRAIDALGQWRGVQFEVPGDLGPRPVRVAPEVVPQAAFQAPPPAGVPATVAVPPAVPAVAPGPAAVPAMAEAAPLPPAAPPVPAAPPDLGAVAGIPGRIAETLGGLLGAPGAGMPAAGTAGSDIDSPALDELDPPALDELEPPALGEAEESQDEEADPHPEDTDEEEGAEIEPEDGPTEVDPVGHPPEPEPDCVPSAPVAAPPPPPVPAATPCEMAADELPQVGE